MKVLGRHKVADKGSIKIENTQVAVIGAIISSTYKLCDDLQTFPGKK